MQISSQHTTGKHHQKTVLIGQTAGNPTSIITRGAIASDLYILPIGSSLLLISITLVK
jgi:hypothetical protein